MAKSELLYTHSYVPGPDCFGVIYTPREDRPESDTQHMRYLRDKHILSKTDFSWRSALLRFQYKPRIISASTRVADRGFFNNYCKSCVLRLNMYCTALPQDKSKGMCPHRNINLSQYVSLNLPLPAFEFVVNPQWRGKGPQRTYLTTPVFYDETSNRVISAALLTGNVASNGLLYLNSPEVKAYGWGHRKNIPAFLKMLFARDITGWSPQISCHSLGTDEIFTRLDYLYETIDLADRTLYPGSFQSYKLDHALVNPDGMDIKRVYVAAETFTNQPTTVHVELADRYVELCSNTYFLKKQFKVRKWYSS